VSLYLAVKTLSSDQKVDRYVFVSHSSFSKEKGDDVECIARISMMWRREAWSFCCTRYTVPNHALEKQKERVLIYNIIAKSVEIF
jgi:hypothetical protein